MTYNEYDKMIEQFDKLDTDVFFPSEDDIAIMEKDPERYIKFACYLHEKLVSENTSQKYSKKALMQFINKHLELVD